MSFKIRQYVQNTISTTGSNTVLIGPIDISDMANMSIIYQNDHTAVGFINMAVQVSAFQEISGTQGADNFVDIDSGIIRVNSALGASSSFLAPAFDSAYKYLRILGATSSIVSASITQGLRITIQGLQKFQ